jgi:hypothetical protein
MDLLQDFISCYGTTIIYTILTAIASYIGVKVKSIYEKYINDKTKKSVVETVCKAVNQMYDELNGEEKLNKAIENITQVLNEKDISISDIEIRMLIESTVYNFKTSLVDENKEKDEESEG